MIRRLFAIKDGYTSPTELGGLVVSVFATGPLGLSVAGSGPAEDSGSLWAIKIRSAHFLRRGSKAVGPMSLIYGV
jgi:hypothetical protein